MTPTPRYLYMANFWLSPYSASLTVVRPMLIDRPVKAASPATFVNTHIDLLQTCRRVWPIFRSKDLRNALPRSSDKLPTCIAVCKQQGGLGTCLQGACVRALMFQTDRRNL